MEGEQGRFVHMITIPSLSCVMCDEGKWKLVRQYKSRKEKQVTTTLEC